MAAALTGAASAQDGVALFADICAGCHGERGVGGFAPNLAGNAFLATPQNLIRQILFGGGPMVGFANVLTNEEIAAIANYVRMDLNAYADLIDGPFVADLRD